MEKTAKKIEWDKKRIIFMLLRIAVVITLIVVFIKADLFYKIFQPKDYKRYKFAIEQVEDNMNYYSDLDFCSFSKTTIEKNTSATTKLIIERPDIDNVKAYDVSGTVKVKNALGNKITRKFIVTIYHDGFNYQCYECVII